MDPPAATARSRRRTVNAVLLVVFLLGAFITAWPLDEAGWYPAVVGVSFLCFSAMAAVLYNAKGTLAQRVDGHRMVLGSMVVVTFFLVGLTFAWESHQREAGTEEDGGAYDAALDGGGGLEQATVTAPDGASSLQGVGVMGVLVLLGTMLGGNLLSRDRRLSGGEVRTAIAVSVIVVFFGLIATGSHAVLQEGTILAETFEHFWKILIAVVGFYFGSLTVEGMAGRFRRTPVDAGDRERPE